IFLAEVASTFHEELLFQHFIKKADSLDKKAYLINQKIDDIRNTLFRQTLFAEFELALHEWVEQDQPLTPALLKEHYLKLNHEYFGEGIKMDPEVAYEWSRIPHFYYNFYVYQYATGISAAHVLAKKVLNKEPLAKEQYLSFLSSGGSQDPLTTLKKAGVDMETSYPVDTMLLSFKEFVCQLRKLMEDRIEK
ncbi:MAG: oligoendopeptidase F, partial [Verrucomicrobia bacterium]|nr:oligoendopeptidase F [Verrucomicrobiota bacterium]